MEWDFVKSICLNSVVFERAMANKLWQILSTIASTQMLFLWRAIVKWVRNKKLFLLSHHIRSIWKEKVLLDFRGDSDIYFVVGNIYRMGEVQFVLPRNDEKHVHMFYKRLWKQAETYWNLYLRLEENWERSIFSSSMPLDLTMCRI